jgi:hypothetical protein
VISIQVTSFNQPSVFSACLLARCLVWQTNVKSNQLPSKKLMLFNSFRFLHHALRREILPHFIRPASVRFFLSSMLCFALIIVRAGGFDAADFLQTERPLNSELCSPDVSELTGTPMLAELSSKPAGGPLNETQVLQSFRLRHQSASFLVLLRSRGS